MWQKQEVSCKAQQSVSRMFLPHFDVFCHLWLITPMATCNLFLITDINQSPPCKNAIFGKVNVEDHQFLFCRNVLPGLWQESSYCSDQFYNFLNKWQNIYWGVNPPMINNMQYHKSILFYFFIPSEWDVHWIEIILFLSHVMDNKFTFPLFSLFS